MHNELVPYAEAWSWQKSIVEERKLLSDKDEDFSDTLIILQHPPVYTLGTASSEDHLKDIKDFYRTERGGEVTYHGPGQVYSVLYFVKFMCFFKFNCIILNHLLVTN